MAKGAQLDGDDLHAQEALFLAVVREFGGTSAGAEACVELGNLLLALGEERRAYHYLRKGAAAGDGQWSPEALLVTAFAAKRRGDLGRAERACRSAAKRFPRSLAAARCAWLLARILQGRGDERAGRRWRSIQRETLAEIWRRRRKAVVRAEAVRMLASLSAEEGDTLEAQLWLGRLVKLGERHPEPEVVAMADRAQVKLRRAARGNGSGE